MAVSIRCRRRFERRLPSSTEAPYFDIGFASFADAARLGICEKDESACCIELSKDDLDFVYELRIIDDDGCTAEPFLFDADAKNARDSFIDLLWQRAVQSGRV